MLHSNNVTVTKEGTRNNAEPTNKDGRELYDKGKFG